MPSVGPLELVILAIIALVIFGPKRLPEVGRSVGEGLRELKSTITSADPRDELKSTMASVDPRDELKSAIESVDPRDELKSTMASVDRRWPAWIRATTAIASGAANTRVPGQPPEESRVALRGQRCDMRAPRRAQIRDLDVAAGLRRKERDRRYRLGRLGMHRKHRVAAFRRRAVAVLRRREDEDEEVEAVVEPRVVDGMRRLAGEPRPQRAELGRALERHEELRVRAGSSLATANSSAMAACRTAGPAVERSPQRRRRGASGLTAVMSFVVRAWTPGGGSSRPQGSVVTVVRPLRARAGRRHALDDRSSTPLPVAAVADDVDATSWHSLSGFAS